MRTCCCRSLRQNIVVRLANDPRHDDETTRASQGGGLGPGRTPQGVSQVNEAELPRIGLVELLLEGGYFWIRLSPPHWTVMVGRGYDSLPYSHLPFVPQLGTVWYL
jgi:hypothetical protein